MSLAEDPSTGAMAAAIADHLADEDARHAQLLDWMVEHGFGSTPQDKIPPEVYARARRELGHDEPPATTPAPPAAPEEDTMPRGVPATPRKACDECGSTTRHRNGCAKASKLTSAKTPNRPAAVRKAKTPLTDLEVEDLLELRREIDGELERREQEHQAALEAIRAARTAA